MKKLYIILFLFLCPFLVKADSSKVNVYVFVTDECITCDIALGYFDKYDKNIKNNININKYNITDKKNEKLLKEILRFRDESIQYVPYIVIGNKSWEGLNDTYPNSIKEKLLDELNIKPEDRYDIMSYISLFNEEKPSKKNEAFPFVLMIFSVSLFIILIISIRKRA